MHTMRKMSREGDEIIVQWDENDPQQVKAAKKRFSQLREKGFALFAVKDVTTAALARVEADDGSTAETQMVPLAAKVKGEQIHEFEPDEDIIARPAFAGG